MPISLGIPLMWGGPFREREKPLLPPGYYYIEARREWLLAVAPNGRRYYVCSDGVLMRQAVRPITLTFYVDVHEIIKLPQKQLP